MYNVNFVTELVKHDLQDFSTSRNNKFLTNALHCLRSELGLKVERQISYAYIKPNEAFQVAYPRDFARYTRLGINYGGRIITLSVNNDLILQNKFTDCGDVLIDEIETTANLPIESTWGGYYAPHYRNGQYIGEQYGQRGGFNANGYFKFFDKQRIIQFDPNFPRSDQFEYILEYVSDGTGDNGMTIISLPAVEPIRRYCHWMEVCFDSSKSLGFIQMKKDEFYYALRMAKDIIHSPTVDEWLDSSYGQYMSGPKR